jgi:hypothetical protein
VESEGGGREPEQQRLLDGDGEENGHRLAQQDLAEAGRARQQAVPGVPGPLVEQVRGTDLEGEEREHDGHPGGRLVDPADRLVGVPGRHRRVQRPGHGDEEQPHQHVADQRPGVAGDQRRLVADLGREADARSRTQPRTHPRVRFRVQLRVHALTSCR